MNKHLLSNTYYNDLKLVSDSYDFSFLKDKTILITGGLGLIGMAIIDLITVINNCKKTNTKIWIADLNADKFSLHYKNTENLYFLKFDALKNEPIDIEFDFIICAAGIATPELYTKMPIETFLTTFNGVKQLLEYSKTHNVKKLLFISSSEIYGLQASNNELTENNYGTIDIDSIRASYAVSKKATELFCKAYSSEYKINTSIVRPGHIFGPTSNSNDHRIASVFCSNAAKKNELILKSNGQQIRSYCYSVDCAGAILYILNKGVTGESYNIGSKKPITILEMAKCLSKYADVKLTIGNEHNNSNFNPMDNSSLSSEKLNILGYSYLFETETGLKHTVEIMKDFLDIIGN